MTDTPTLGLPLVQPSQAQKHVTVNEALSRLDGLVQLAVLSRSVAVPPTGAGEGACYLVPPGAVGDWEGLDGALARRTNGGWVAMPPRAGWRAWVADEARFVLHDGGDWVAAGAAVGGSGSGFDLRVIELDHAVAPGAHSVTVPLIPAGALVFAVTGRVLADLGGTATGFRLGVAGAEDRYGSGIGPAAQSWLRGVTGAPVAYYAETPLVLSADGGTFGGGALRLAVHLAEFAVPRA